MDIAHRHADKIIVSVFVNPTQFGPNEDLDKYPRDFERDQAVCEAHGVDAIFYPTPQLMYAPDFSTWVHEDSLSQLMCGQSRPIHFRGVCTVCTKLFNISLCDVAVFGKKDAQQALIIRRMVRDLNMPLQIVLAPLVREADGLAMSSRNKYLSAEEHQRALSISKGIFAAQKRYEEGERNADALKRILTESIQKGEGQIDYVVLMDQDTLRPIEQIDRPALLACAAFFGKTRLIDNVFLE
jgi:pantoate--beta-alanine ligase